MLLVKRQKFPNGEPTQEPAENISPKEVYESHFKESSDKVTHSDQNVCDIVQYDTKYYHGP